METAYSDLKTTVKDNTILQLHNICFSYHSLLGETDVLHNISFSVKEGEFIAIVGPSGCGKSTLLNILCGLIKAKEGHRIISDNISISGLYAMLFNIWNDASTYYIPNSSRN